MTRIEIYADKNLKLSEKMIFLFLNESKNKELRLSHRDIGNGVAVDPRNVQKPIQTLVSKDYIKRMKYVGNKCNSYEILK